MMCTEHDVWLRLSSLYPKKQEKTKFGKTESEWCHSFKPRGQSHGKGSGGAVPMMVDSPGVMTMRLDYYFSSTYSLSPSLLYYTTDTFPLAPCNSLELDLPSDTKARTRCLADCAPPPLSIYMLYPCPYRTIYACISTC